MRKSVGSLSLCLSLSPPTLSLHLSLPVTLSLALTLPHTHTHTLSLSLSHSLYPPSNTHTRTHTHTNDEMSRHHAAANTQQPAFCAHHKGDGRGPAHRERPGRVFEEQGCTLRHYGRDAAAQAIG